ncbi:MAG: tetratricopeptide repeat protein, partial [Pseudomonadota bacterium]
MRTDLFGSDTSLTRPEAVEAWNATQMAFLAHGAATPEHLGRTLTLAPDFALAHATKGLFLMLLGRRALVPDAAAAHARAQSLVAEGGAFLRERRYVAALGHYLDGHLARAAAEFETVCRETPQDATAAKLAHAIHFVLGDSARLLG